MALSEEEEFRRLSTEADIQADLYKQLQVQTRGLIANQKSLLNALGLQRTSIMGSVAHLAATMREGVKTMQLKRLEYNLAKAQFEAARKKAELDRQDLELRRRQFQSVKAEYGQLQNARRRSSTGMLSSADEKRFAELQRIKSRTDAAEARSTASAKTERSLASDVKAAASSKTGAMIDAVGSTLKAGLNVASVALSAFGGAVSAVRGVLSKFISSIVQTQKDFGVTMSQAAKIQTDLMIANVKNLIQTFKSLDFTGLGGIVQRGFSAFFQAGRGISASIFGETTLSNVGTTFADTIKGVYDDLTKERPITPGERAAAATFIDPQERINAMRDIQAEFGVFDSKTRESVALLATQRGITTQQIVQARRVFATQTLGDYRKVEEIQNRFLGIFQQKGMTAKTAMEVIAKNADLMARNGLRFADSFARAAADAKKIGVDLGKVDQFGDNIIDNFEGFLEGAAELGALGLNVDTTRLMEVAYTGNTSDLFNEITSQLRMVGKDLTNLTRPERLALEKFMGMSIAELQRMAGAKPEKTSEELLQEESNSLLSNILTAMRAADGALQLLSGPLGIVAAIGTVTTALGTIFDLLVRGFMMIPGVSDEAKKELLLSQISGAKTPEERTKYEEMYRKEFYTPRSDAFWNIATLGYTGLGPGSGERVARDIENARRRYYRDKPEELARYNESVTFPFGRPQTQTTFPGLTTTPFSTQNNVFGNTVGVPSGPRKSTGGLITGPGTGTSDSIPTMLSNGEYVINAAAAKKIGLTTLDALNQAGTIAKMQNGGIVIPPTRSSSISPTINPFGRDITVGTTPKPTDTTGVFDRTKDTISTAKKGSDVADPFLQTFLGAKRAASVPQVQFSPAVRSGNVVEALFGNKKIGGQLFPEVQKKVAQQVLGFLPKETLKSMSESTKGTPISTFFKKAIVSGGDEILDTYKNVSKLAGASSAANFIFKKIAPITMAADLGIDLSKGDYLSATETVTKFLVGKVAGAATGIGMTTLAAGAVPATAGGSLALSAGIPAASIGADMAGQAAVEFLFDMYRGRYKGKKYHSGGIIGEPGSDEVPAMLQKGEAVVSKLQFGNLNRIIENINTIAVASSTTPSTDQTPPQIKIDMTALEQKLDQFVRALSSIEVNMDGNKVGNMLVNTSKATSNIGILRTQATPSIY